MIPALILALASAGPPQEPEAVLQLQLRAEDDYRAGRYAECLDRLEALWERLPPGSDGWARCLSPRREFFPGHPACYSALRMLTDCARWRLDLARRHARPPKARPVVWTIVLVGRSQGIEPRSMAELEAGQGVPVRHELDPRLLADDHRVIRQSTWLFREFVLAMTEGRLPVDLRFLHLPDLELPVSASARGLRHAGLAPGALPRLWEEVPGSVRSTTDWWWVLYPSHVPEQYPDFERTEFITGGMATGPDGASPCFLIDDRWLLRKPPHLGKGEYSDEERRAYLPQWLAHEFFHHLFRTWPEFGLEARSHQWFDHSTWPEDFQGRFEVDYFLEALHKRLQPRAAPPLHIGLRYAPPPPELWRRIRLADIPGRYERRPVENPWHRGRIVRAGRRDGRPLLRWENDAGVAWELAPDLEHGVLRTGPDNPYYEDGNRVFRLELRRDDNGAWVPDIVGFRFGGQLYRRLP